MGAFKLLMVVLVLFAVSLANDWSLPDRLIVTLLVVLLLCWIWNRLSLQRLGVRRALTLDRVRAGEWISESITVRNHALLPKLWVEVRDMSTLPGYQAGKVTNLGSRGQAQWTTSGRCTRRGRFRLGPITLVSGDPLGLFRSVKTIDVSHELVVYPPRVDVSRIPLPKANMVGSASASLRGFHAAHTISGIREYATGDPLNRISWSATARLGRMMVKEFDPDPSSDIWIILDLQDEDGNMESHHDRRALATPDESIEYAIAVAGSLAEDALAQGRRVGLIVNRAMPIRIEPDSSQRQWFRVFEVLAVASRFGHRTLSDAIAADSRRFTRNSGVIVVTTHQEAGWVPAAHALALRQVPVTAVLVGDASDLAGSTMHHLKTGLLEAHVQIAEVVPGTGIMDSESGSRRVA